LPHALGIGPHMCGGPPCDDCRTGIQDRRVECVVRPEASLVHFPVSRKILGRDYGTVMK
jgi:hypothetical protein